jgi:hypothetical protein
MKHRTVKLTLAVIMVLLFVVSCAKATKGAVSGVALKNGKPASGTIRILDPSNLNPIAENKIYKDGKFFIKDVPTGEWLIALTGRTGGVIGNYHYVIVRGIGMAPDLKFDAMDEDPKAQELIEKASENEDSEEQQE